MVKRGPFDHQGAHAPRDITMENLERIDRKESLVFGVFRVKVRRRMIVVVHADRYSIEVRNPRHVFVLQLLGDAV
jgi:hypothetical protein